MDNPKQNIISIATGIGGLEAGLHDAGLNIHVSVYVEIEAFIIANLVTAMEADLLGAAPIWTDIKTFPAKYFHRKIHGITAGYPCQPFSKAGKREGVNDPRHIFPDILRTIKTVEPIWCFFENVEDHLSLGYGEVYRSLRDLGYKIEAGIFSAEEVGASHRRKRLYILAIKLEYSNVTEVQRMFFRDEKKFSFFRNSSKMANSNFNDRGSVSGEFPRKAEEIKITSQRKNRQRSRSKSCNGSEVLSDTDSSRKRESLLCRQSKQFNENGYKWPATRGQSQFEWEHPRTIKPGMGSSINGNDFRIDLLRALGNGVVKQTATKAFLTLIDKFN